MTKCEDCGACPAESRCECDFAGVRVQRRIDALEAQLEAAREALETAEAKLALTGESVVWVPTVTTAGALPPTPPREPPAMSLQQARGSAMQTLADTEAGIAADRARERAPEPPASPDAALLAAVLRGLR